MNSNSWMMWADNGNREIELIQNSCTSTTCIRKIYNLFVFRPRMPRRETNEWNWTLFAKTSSNLHIESAKLKYISENWILATAKIRDQNMCALQPIENDDICEYECKIYWFIYEPTSNEIYKNLNLMNWILWVHDYSVQYCRHNSA